MHRTRRSLAPLFLTALLLGGAGAVANDRGIADPGFLEDYASTYRFRLGRPTSIRLTPDGRAVLFLRSGPRSFERNLYELDVKSGRERELLTAQSILRGAEERLTAEEKARRERMRLAARGIASYVLSRDGKRLLVPLSGRLFVVERASGSVRELESDAGFPIDPQFSPDATKVACVRSGELYVTDIASGEERRLTTDAGGTISNGLAEFVAQEEMSRYHGFWWSPDSRFLVYQQTDTEGLEIMNIMDATHPEIAPETWPYPRPGRRNAAVRLGIIAADGGSTTWINWDQRNFEYLATVRWAENSPLTILVQDRRQREQQLLAVDPASGATETLLVERDDAWVEIDQSVPRWLADGSAFLWTTERGGALQLELRGADGGLERVLTPPEFGLQGLLHYSSGRHEVTVRASTNPTETHLYTLSLDADPGPPLRLTDEPGLHDATFSRNSAVWVHQASLLSGESRWDVLGPPVPRGTRLDSRAETPPFTPQVELTTVGSAPELHAALIRPRNFEAGERYPVIVHVYGGPTSQMVRAHAGRYLLDQWIADHGYVVVAIDGRGTPNRGRDWQRIVRGDLIGVPLADQARGVRLLGEKYDELDLTRVGIYGWSFGGYFSAMAVMREPGLFRAGVAGAPVVDWADYDTHYTERYMDLPQRNESGYRAANVLTYAADLERPLMIVHGTADDNVYFMHSLKLADALFRAGKPFEFLPLAGFTHMVPDPLITRRLYSRIMDFLERHVRSPVAGSGEDR
jgi:dipeptidyl-peptidase-4